MIPTTVEIKDLWRKYQLPLVKQIHCSLVAKAALWMAQQIKEKVKENIDENLLQAAALLHDIDKNISKLPGEQHPDTAVRILVEEQMEEVARLVKKHPLHAILDPLLRPVTWEEKLLFLADKMVKNDIGTVDSRFSLWRKENLPPAAQRLLKESYPKVKALEAEVFDLIGISCTELKERV